MKIRLDWERDLNNFFTVFEIEQILIKRKHGDFVTPTKDINEALRLYFEKQTQKTKAADSHRQREPHSPG